MTIGVLGPASSASAHGNPPEALSIVATDGDGGVAVVRLNEGLAVRDPEGAGFRYLCPALWGDDVVAPAESIPDGPVVVGASSGLLVLEDGEIVPHRDALAEGRVIALAGTSSGLFALRQAGDLFEVLRVEEQSVRVLWSSTEPWQDLSAGEDFVQAVRLAAGRLVALRLSADGMLLAREEVEVPGDSVAVLARAAGRAAYAVLLTSALDAELGRIERGAWRSLLDGRSIEGPIETADGARFVAVDGELAAFDREQQQPLARSANVTCLRRHFGLGYACSVTELRALADGELGATLFSLRELVAPDLETVPGEQRAACELQWQRYAVDLRAIGIEPDVIGARDAGALAPDAAAGAAALDRDAGMPGDAGASPRASESSGCRATGHAEAGASAATPGWALLAALLVRSRRRARGGPGKPGDLGGGGASASIKRLRTGPLRPCRRRRTS